MTILIMIHYFLKAEEYQDLKQEKIIKKQIFLMKLIQNFIKKPI